MIHPPYQALIIDGKMQSAEVDEFIYHESLIHPPLLFHPKYYTESSYQLYPFVDQLAVLFLAHGHT